MSTTAQMLYGLLSQDAPIVALVGVPSTETERNQQTLRISQTRPPIDGQFPAVFFQAIGDEAEETLNHGYGTIPETWAIESWALNARDRDELRDAIRDRLSGYRASGTPGIILQPGGSALEADDAPLYGWQDTYRVVHAHSLS